MIPRRELITLLGGAAAWPLAARAQQGNRMRRIGMLMPLDENDPEAKLRYSAFTQALAGLGWTDGGNVRIDRRGSGGDTNRIRALAQELVGLQLDIIVTNGTPATVAVQQLMPSFETAARSLKVAPITKPVRSDAEIEAAIIDLGREPGGGLVILPDGFTSGHRAPIILAAARNNLPAVYQQSVFVREGGLLSYGTDVVDSFPRAASYVDRILRGEKPGDLPVQLPTKFEMAVNLKTAKALGLAIPPSIRLRADEVIE
jgi:ABC-type uncharacterized transport system substrate-binding protein